MKVRASRLRLPWQVGFMLLIAAVPAFATAWWHPRSPFAEPPTSAGANVGATGRDAVVLGEFEVDIATALGWGGRALWIDARPDASYQAELIPGALHLNEGRWEDGLFEVLDRVTADTRVVVYCGSQQCGASHAVADRLREETGLEHVYILHRGWDAWREAHR